VALSRQWPETEALLGPWLRLYQVHSATVESGILDDPVAHQALARLGVPVGLSLSGPGQAVVLRRALSVEVDGSPLFSAVQATWNLLETSAGPALAEAKEAGWTVIIKEALANGRLALPGPLTAGLGEHPDAVALAAALTQPWADVVLSGAATVGQMHSNLSAVDLSPPKPGSRPVVEAQDPMVYWQDRAAMRWT
jgi:aryl-alcohol dehydrogenase-like predicted oxidoreductase